MNLLKSFCLFLALAVLAGCSEESKLKVFASNGNVDSQMKLADSYYTGNDKIKQDYKEAFSYYSKAANANNIDAQMQMVWMTFDGKGTDRDADKAVEYLVSFSKKGNMKAQEVLGSMYYYGIFVEKSYKDAFEWFLKSAENGSVYSQEKLGDMYYGGEFVTQNYPKALEWYNRAANAGNLYAKIAAAELEQMKIKGKF